MTFSEQSHQNLFDRFGLANDNFPEFCGDVRDGVGNVFRHIVRRLSVALSDAADSITAPRTTGAIVMAISAKVSGVSDEIRDYGHTVLGSFLKSTFSGQKSPFN